MRTTLTTTEPWATPCLVTTTTFTITVDGIPGAAASAHMLISTYGLIADWMPLADPMERMPYAFVALGLAVHAAWFLPGRYVEGYELTACGTWFHTLREPLLARAAAPSTTGPCEDCLIVWRARYD